MILYDIIWYYLILYDIIWYYMILYDIIWYYMILYVYVIYIWLGHANQDFYHFKPGLQHLSSRRKDFICQLTQCQLSSSIIRTSIKEHLQPIKTQSNDRKPQTTNQIPAQPCAAKEAMGKRARQLSGSSYLVIMYFNFHRLIWNSFGILVPPLATISICMPTSFEATLLPTIPLLHPLIAMTTTSMNTATATAIPPMMRRIQCSVKICLWSWHWPSGGWPLVLKTLKFF